MVGKTPTHFISRMFFSRNINNHFLEQFNKAEQNSRTSIFFNGFLFHGNSFKDVVTRRRNCCCFVFVGVWFSTYLFLQIFT